MRSLGVSNDRAVVVYDAADSSVAARAWWCLRYFGHTEVQVLDGGFAAWVAEGGVVESGDQPHIMPGRFVATPGGMPAIDAEQASEIARSGLLLDARAGARYRGESEPVDPVAGHIPGAVNAPTSLFVRQDGHLLSPQDLRSRFAVLAERDLAAYDARNDSQDASPVAAYCGSGVNAAHVVLAGTIAGLLPSLYVGSWSDWVSEASRPIAQGAKPG